MSSFWQSAFRRKFLLRRKILKRRGRREQPQRTQRLQEQINSAEPGLSRLPAYVDSPSRDNRHKVFRNSETNI